MDWNEIITQIILGIVGIIISTLGSFLIYFIKNKIKNEKVANIMCDGLQIVSDGVNYVYQTYVEKLKGTDLWDEKAMEEANQQAIKYIENNLSNEMKKYLTNNNKDLNNWIKEQIEVAINQAKKVI